ncbi:MAG: hypothetical protein V2I43_26175 [Parvularcula sp.]|nr:hypothetical protein [Parvularcula sp.]
MKRFPARARDGGLEQISMQPRQLAAAVPPRLFDVQNTNTTDSSSLHSAFGLDLPLLAASIFSSSAIGSLGYDAGLSDPIGFDTDSLNSSGGGPYKIDPNHDDDISSLPSVPASPEDDGSDPASRPDGSSGSELKPPEIFEAVQGIRTNIVGVCEAHGVGAILILYDPKDEVFYDLRYPPSKKLERYAERLWSIQLRHLQSMEKIHQDADDANDLDLIALMESLDRTCRELGGLKQTLSVLTDCTEIIRNKRFPFKPPLWVLSEAMYYTEQRKRKHRQTVSLRELESFDRYNRLRDFRDRMRKEMTQHVADEVIGEIVCIYGMYAELRNLYSAYRLYPPRG